MRQLILVAVETPRALKPSDVGLTVGGLQLPAAAEVLEFGHALAAAVDRNSTLLGGALVELRDVLDEIAGDADTREPARYGV
jgi:hypothetical protein